MKDGTPGGKQQQFYRCGMDTPCDGDDNKFEKDFEVQYAFPTWCFVSPDCETGIITPGTEDRHVYITKRETHPHWFACWVVLGRRKPPVRLYASRDRESGGESESESVVVSASGP